MSTTWILVANARHARLFANHGPNKGLELVHEEEVNEAEDAMRMPVSGRASPRGEPPRHSAKGFAHSLARHLHHGRSRGDYARAILVAPPAFMGMLNNELDGHTASLISDRLDKDYTRSEPDQLRAQLGTCLCA